jgi:hypothetical protein
LANINLREVHGKIGRYLDYSNDPETEGKLACMMDNINRYIRWAFCRDSNNLTDEFIKDIWFNGHISEFHKLVSMGSYSGEYKDRADYDYYFFIRLGDKLNLSKSEDVKTLFMLGLPYSGYSNFAKDIVEKIMNECPECYEILEYSLNNEMIKCMPTVYACLKAYHNIEGD